MFEPQHIRQVSTLTLRCIASLAATIVLGAGVAPAEVQVTSLDGELLAGGRHLALHSEIPSGQLVELSEAGRSSLLVGDDSLVQLCAGAKASFEDAASGGPGRVELRQGEISAVLVATPGEASLDVRTPEARIEVFGTAVLVTVNPNAATTTVSSLGGQVRVSPIAGAGPFFIDADEQITVAPGQALGEPSGFDRKALMAASSCLRPEAHRASAAAASSLMLVTAAAHVDVHAEDAIAPASDLAQIIAADIPEEEIPIGEASTPSALITELSKAGLDEEVCDPITCNPVYQLPSPEPCGDPPETGCIP